MNEDIYQQIKINLENELRNLNFEDRFIFYKRLYYSNLAKRTTPKKIQASIENGKLGGRPQIPVSKMKTPKQALSMRRLRKKRAELNNKK